MIVSELITKLGFHVDESGANKFKDILKEIGGGILKYTTIAGAIAGVIELGKKSIETAAAAERIETNFSMILRSEEKAKKMIGDIGDFSKKAAIPLETLQGTAEKLLRGGVAQNNILPIMKMLGDAAGGDQQRFDQLSTSYARMQIRGVANSRELIAMGRASGPLYAILEKQLGVNYEGLMKLGAKGKISIGEINKAFQTMTEKGGIFHDGLEKQAMTLNGMMVLLKNNFTIMFEKLGTTLMPVIKEVIGMITELVGPITNVIDSVFSVVTPILHSVFNLVNQVLKPVLGFVVQLFTALKPVTDIVISVVDKVLSVVSDVLSGELMDRMGTMIPFIKMFADELGEIWKLIQPLFAVMLRLFGKEMTLAIGINGGLFKGWLWIMERIYPVVFRITNAIVKYLVPAVTWVYEKFEGIYNWMLNILHLTKQAGKDTEKMLDDVQKDVINQQKTMNLNMDNNININTPGLTPSDFQNAMGQVTREIFNKEMKKVWQTAM